MIRFQSEFLVTKTDSPNRSSEDNTATVSAVEETSWMKSDAFRHQDAATQMINGVPVPNEFGEGVRWSVTADAETTSSEGLRNLQYCMDTLLLLRDHAHYYNPREDSIARNYFKVELEHSFRRLFDAILFAFNVGGNSLSGDMLSELTRAVGSLRNTDEPARAVRLISKLLNYSDPLVADSMVVALSDFGPQWAVGAKGLMSAAAKIRWEPIRSEAISALEAMDTK